MNIDTKTRPYYFSSTLILSRISVPRKLVSFLIKCQVDSIIRVLQFLHIKPLKIDHRGKTHLSQRCNEYATTFRKFMSGDARIDNTNNPFSK